MKFPEGMPEELKEALSKALGINGDEEKCVKGQCQCQQVVKLTGDMLLRLKQNSMNSDKWKNQVDSMKVRAELINAKNRKMWSDFWDKVYTTYGLNPGGNYHWVSDGRIMKRPEDA